MVRYVPEIVRLNAYRVLRLSASAASSEIHKAAASMRRAATLGLISVTDADFPQLGEVNRTEADIRTATGRIENPEHRLKDRLFWFHLTPKPLDPDTSARLLVKFQEDPKATTALNHDKALHSLFSAFIGDLNEAGIRAWVEAIQAWHQVISDDNYWALTCSLEERGQFEPHALVSEIDALREDAVRLATEPFVVAAREAVAKNDLRTASRIFAALDQLTETGHWASNAQEDIAAPSVEPFRKLCEIVSDEISKTILREQGEQQHNKSVCDKALKRFQGEIEPALDRIMQLITPDHFLLRQAREDAAQCLNIIAINFTWKDDFAGSEKLFEQALKLAGDTVSAIKIESGLSDVREALRKERLLGPLQPVSSAPSLYTLNGFGFTMYGNTDYDSDTRSYVATHYFVALFIPIFPIARYRVISDKDNHYRFLGKLPLRNGDRLHLWGALAAIAAVIFGSVINSDSGSKTSSNSYKNNSGSVYTPATTPNYGPPSTATAPTNTRNAQLSSIKEQIENGRSRHAALEKQLQPVMDELIKLSARMKELKAELNALDERQRLYGSVNTATYNSRVDTHNSLLARHQALLSANRNDIDTLNNLEKQDSTLVEQYNALLKR